MKSTGEVAELLGVTVRDISHHARQLGIPKVGRVYGFSEGDIERIKKKMRPKKCSER